MAQQIRRSGSAGVRQAARAQNRAATARAARGRAGSLVDGAFGLLPFTAEQWSRIWLAIIIGGGVGLAFVIASLAGLPALARAEVAAFAAEAGFEVRHVRVTGTSRMDERTVYALALAERQRAMPEVDIARLRASLKALPWVKDARVSIQLPHTLAIDIVEREPRAVLERGKGLALIDATGAVLGPVAAEKAKGMLRIAGRGADKQVARLETLLAAAPALAPRVVRAEWVGNRRWNLTFESTQVLALPEGDVEAASSLIKFARLDGQNRLIGGTVLAFDMRSPPHLYMRLPHREGPPLALARAGSGAVMRAGEQPDLGVE